MGMNVVVIVEIAQEKKPGSVANFEAGLKSDQWGQFARLIPIVNEQSVEMAFAGLRGQVVYHADLNEPTADEWEEL